MTKPNPDRIRTVADLIARLQTFPPDERVVFESNQMPHWAEAMVCMVNYPAESGYDCSIVSVSGKPVSSDDW